MKKLFLWTFILTLLCTWAIAGADQTPTVSNAPVGEKTLKAEKAAQEMISGKAALSNVMTTGLKVKKEKVEVQQTEPAVMQAREFAVPVKAPSLAPVTPPDPNVILQGGDRCEDATLIPSLPYTDNGTTCGYTNDYDEVCPYTGSTAPDVVYSYTPEADICVDITLCLGTTDYDTKLYVYEDVCQVPDDGQDPYACNDDACEDPFLFVSELNVLDIYAGHTYYIVVDGYGSGCGNYTIEVTEVECPVDPCENAFYHNGAPDWVNGYACDRRDYDAFEIWIVDDVELLEETHIADIHWWAAERAPYVWQNTDDYIILADAAGAPGAEIYEEFDVWNVRYATGEIFFGDPVYVYTLYVDITLPAGLYWMGFRPVNQGTSGQSFWATAPLTGYDVYLRSAYFGYPDWTPGVQVFGVTSNVAFCLTDEPIPTGACCDDATGECIDYVPVTECPPPLRWAQDVLCVDLDPPCGGVTGACCDPATGDCLELTASECADAFGGTGVYMGDFTVCDPNPCPGPCYPDYSVTAPVENATGTTCGAINDCDLRDTEDIIYEVEIPNDGEWNFSLCDSDYDTYMFVGTTCCGQEVGYNDDFCGLQSQVTAYVTAGTYYVDIEGYSGCGNYVFNVFETQECVVECPPGGLDEGEPCDQDTNGGCNTDPINPPTTPIACGDTYCGLGWFDGSTRDTDWYLFEIPGGGEVTVTLMAEFDALFGIIVPYSQDICDNSGSVDYYDLPLACEDGFVQATLAGDRPYVIFVAPQFTNLVTCGDYWVTVECGECENYVDIEIFTDDYPSETTWDLVHVATGVTVGSGGPLSDPQTLHTWEICVDNDPTGCYQFTIYDAYGDGISLPPGYYNVYDPTGALVCTGGDDFGSAETCFFGTCVGACCVGIDCVGDMSIEECEALGGVTYIGESCDDFVCPLDCSQAIYHNGEGIGGAFASQCDTEYPMQAEVCDDFVLEGAEPIEIGSIVAWVGFWNADPLCTPGDVESFIFDVYNDNGQGTAPGGNPVDMDPDCAREGDIVWTHEYAQGEFGYMEEPPGYWRIWVEVPSGELVLDPGVTYWLGVAPRIFFSTWGQGGPQPSGMQQGSPCLLYFPLLGYVEWTDVWGQDMAFCLNPAGEEPDCDYTPGDCDHSGVPLELADVIAMIGMYRGTVTPVYTCECPPHGTIAPEADPNGNCVPLELADVVAQIAAYRGTGTAYGCADCPGDGPPPPGLLGPDGTSVIPSMKSKVKTTQQGSAD